jgi:hypothetical protein
MSAIEIRKEINKTLENIPEAVLEDILSFLKQLEKQKSGTITLVHDLRKIISEDKELLEKLAQ